ncbi:unnamed protein product [Peniophora sp. CBMAI 1063]|nr:unnamed protein product [Peniophora sp. CBMAI 1063]
MSSAETGDPARKRAREDEGGDAASEPSVVRSQDFYFNDGTIALRALSKDKNCYTIYRVHKSLLALHCSVFRDMFGDTDTIHFDAASEKYDGVPLMHLHDEPEDIRDFLKALYDPAFMHRHLDHNLCYMKNFPRAYNKVMRLAKKYGSQKLLDVFAHALRQEWPSKLKLVSAVRQSRAAKCEVLEEEDDEFDDEDHDHNVKPDPAWTIRMAIDYDVPEVLPSAFATFNARLGPGLNGATEDGSHSLGEGLEDGLFVLNADELRHLVIGGRTLASYVFGYTSEYPVPEQGTFFKPESNLHQCYARFCNAWTKMNGNLENTYGSSHPFDVLRDALTECDLCKFCRPKARAHIHEIELDLWKKLPAIFDLRGYGVSEDWGS